MNMVRQIAHYRSAAFAALLYGILLTGCGPTQKGSKAPETGKQIPERLCPFSESDPEQRVVQWAMGCEEMRQSPPPSSAATALTYGNAPQPPTCVAATTLLPAPDGRQVFAAGGETLYEIDLPDGKPTELPVAPPPGQPPGWRFSRLLAFEHEARPRAILAEMVRDQGSQSDYALWRIEMRGKQAAATQLTPAQVPRTTHAFFSRYSTPRCKDGPRDCIVTVGKNSGAGKARIQIRRGTPTQKEVPGPPGTRSVLDAAWMPGKAGDTVLLVEHPDC